MTQLVGKTALVAGASRGIAGSDRWDDAGMVALPGGSFSMGSNHHYPEERPMRRVHVDAFQIDRHPVTNAEFAAFVTATDYLTVAERTPDPADYPGLTPETAVAGSSVFVKPVRLDGHARPEQWWVFRAGAHWRHPEGPGSSIADRRNHPVVHVAFADAIAYAQWVGKELPSEAEWEYAARGGLEGGEFAWGDELTPGGRHMANIWQGRFPIENLTEDGYEGTSPIDAFPANLHGLLDMIGNVWEWTQDWFAPPRANTDANSLTAAGTSCCKALNPQGGSEGESYDPGQLDILVPRKVVKGGSYLCASNYCRRYRPAARHAQQIDTGTSHIGFRCVVRRRKMD